MSAIEWKSGKSGNWDTAADWKGGVVPGAGDDVTIDAAGAFGVTISSSDAAYSLTLDNATASIVDTGTLTLGSALILTAGTFDLENGGVISGGTLSAGRGAFVFNGGTLDGVTFDGAIDLSASDASLAISSKGLIATGKGGKGAGTINLSGESSDLFAQNTQTLDNAAINLLGANARITQQDTTGEGAILTLGVNLAVDQTGNGAGTSGGLYGGASAGDAIVNAGTINIDGVFHITAHTFMNSGVINVGQAGDGGVLDITANAFANTGTMDLLATSYGVNFNDSLSTTQLGKITGGAGATLDFAGGLDNTGATLTVAVGEMIEGSITGGTIAAAGSGIAFNSGALSGVTFDGTLNLGRYYSDIVVTKEGLIARGANGTGDGTINVGFYTSLYFQGAQTITNATINIGEHGYLRGGSGLTLGVDLTIDQVGAYVSIAGETVTNLGMIVASYRGGQFGIRAGTFINAGTITVANGDTLKIGGYGDHGYYWSNAGLIRATDAAVDLGGAFTLGALGDFVLTKSAVSITGELNLAGSTFYVGTGAELGIVTLARQGVISGGTIVEAGSGIVFNGGTLNGVTFDGALNLTGEDSHVAVDGGVLIVKGAGGVGNGVVNITGASSSLYFEDTQTFDNATVNIGSARGASIDEIGNGATLTLGVNLAIDQTGRYARIEGAVINAGTINASFKAGEMNIGYLTNFGVIDVTNRDTLTINGVWSNAGTITAAYGTINLDGVWSNVGMITATDSTIDLGGSFGVASLGNFVHTDSRIAITGTLNNAGSILNVGAGTSLGAITLSGTGTIAGGTVVAAGQGVFFDGGCLDGVTFDGALKLTETHSYVGVTSNGLIVKGAHGVDNGVIDLTGDDSSLDFQDTQTFDNATIDIGGASASGAIGQRDTTGGGAILTLGVNVAINQTGKYAEISGDGYTGDEILNRGIISASYRGGRFDINPFPSVTGETFVNMGVINVSNGDTLKIGGAWSNAGTITAMHATVDLYGNFSLAELGNFVDDNATVTILGTLDNAGGTLNVGTGTELGTVTLGSSGLASGVITGGVIANAGSGMVFNEGTLDGVTFEGPLDLDSGNAHVFITSKGLIVEGAGGAGKGVVNITSSFGEISFQNTQTFTNATINLGGGIDEQDTTHTGGTLTLGVNLTIDQKGEYAGIDSTSYAGDAVVNRGTITASYKGGRFEIESQTFTNLGTITVSNGDTLDLYPTKLVNLSGGTLSGGEFDIGAGSTLALKIGQAVTTDDATIILSGAGSAFQGGDRIDSTLATIGAAGTLELLARRNWSSSLTVSNEGTLDLGGGTFKSARLNNTGVVSGYGVIDTGVADAGVIEAASGTLEFGQLINGRGSLQIDAGATLQAEAFVAPTLTASFVGVGGVLALSRPALFKATIAGFASGDTIDLLQKAATSATLETGDKLVVTGGGRTIATLQLSGDYGGDSFAVAADGQGGTDVTLVTPMLPDAPAAPRFIQAMSSLGAPSAGQAIDAGDARRPWTVFLAAPHVAIA